ncbi:MAG: SRPBCC domain-containing protein [Deltaproteobacteria bacterium]|nr:SRPBCC domain-containing protein [Deltaproteobacteria bacterium]
MSVESVNKSLSLTWDLRHAPEKVWRALTQPDLLARWLMANDLRPQVGHTFTFRQEPTPWWDGIVRCEVLEIESHRRIRYTWRSGSGATELDTVVTWTLTPTASGGTRLELEQSGFLPGNAHAYDGASKGWERMVGEALVGLLDAS